MRRRQFVTLVSGIGYTIFHPTNIMAEPHGLQDYLQRYYMQKALSPPRMPRDSVITRIDIHIASQTLVATSNTHVSYMYQVSTATKGIGNVIGSNKTPLGKHQICCKFGDGAPPASVFVARVQTGSIAKIVTSPIRTKQDTITSRIMWLDGVEIGKNKGGKVDSKNRYIYIHGTHEEGLIGTPASKGCIRMKNRDVIELYQHTPLYTLVEIHQI